MFPISSVHLTVNTDSVFVDTWLSIPEIIPLGDNVIFEPCGRAPLSSLKDTDEAGLTGADISLTTRLVPDGYVPNPPAAVIQFGWLIFIPVIVSMQVHSDVVYQPIL